MKMKEELEDPFADLGKVDWSYRKKKKQSRGYRKMVKTMYALTQHPRFKQEILKLRSKYEIPKEGFKSKNLGDLYEAASNARFTEWKYYKPDSLEEFIRRGRAIAADVEEIARHANLYYFGFTEPITAFLFFNQISYKEFRTLADFFDASSMDVCNIESLSWIVEQGKQVGIVESDKGMSRQEKEDALGEHVYFFELLKQFPVSVAISRYASREDVLDFIRKNWPDIRKRLTENSRKDEGVLRARTRLTWDRYEYIWRYKNIRPRSRLAEMVNKKFGCDVDAIYVRNIISRERKRRGEKT